LSKDKDGTKVTVIFPTKNEETTIGGSIKAAQGSKHHPQIIVVDGFSVDNTRKIAEELGADVVLPEKRVYPGKGVAMTTALRRAFQDSPDIILFLDADIRNLTSEWVDNLIKPILEGGYDMARGSYLRAPRDAPVTKLVARPLLEIFFPEISYLDQPLSGEVSAKAGVWDALLKRGSPDGWGIDIWLLIEASILGYNIREVFLGFKEHKSFSHYSEDVVKLSKMSEQVALTIIKEAVKYNRIDNVRDAPT
jgi:glycosyltransferase involved in cell wall biosynthesis